MTSEKISNTKVHYDHIDYLKAIAAFFVVIGHCTVHMGKYKYIDYSTLPIGTWIAVIVSSVHVPLFFVIAGYLCHRQSYADYVLKKVKRIIFPYLTFSALKIIFSVFIDNEFAHGTNITEVLYDIFILGGAYWFIFCMFIIYLIAPFTWKKGSQKFYNTKILLTIGLLIIINVINVDFGIKLFPQKIMIGNFEANTPFFQIERVFMYFPYFCLGRLIKENNETFRYLMGKNKIILSIFSSVTVLVLSVLVVYEVLKKGFIVKLILALCLMYIIYNICIKLPKGIKMLKIAGKYSLHIMLFDGLFRVILFGLTAMVVKMNLILSIIIAFLDVCLACIASYIISKIPFIKTLFGL